MAATQSNRSLCLGTLRRPTGVLVAVLLLACMMGLAACVGQSSQGNTAPLDPVFTPAVYDAQAAQTDGANFIDVSHADEGYLGAASISEGKLKAHVECGEASYNYDLPNNGEPIIMPVNMGNGSYTVRIMRNTEANRYVELFSTTTDVALVDETAPFVRPNVFCGYDENSACVAMASQLVAGLKSQGEALDAILGYVSSNISYDREKAAMLQDATGYVPDPDATLAEGKGVCFDYASLTAAMLRSQGIPCKILTGYVSPRGIYHAWDMIYVDGSWTSLHISAPNGDWARADMTFEASGASDTIGDGSAYSERYTY